MGNEITASTFAELDGHKLPVANTQTYKMFAHADQLKPIQKSESVRHLCHLAGFIAFADWGDAVAKLVDLFCDAPSQMEAYADDDQLVCKKFLEVLVVSDLKSALQTMSDAVFYYIKFVKEKDPKPALDRF